MSKSFVYRGILVEVGEGYAFPRRPKGQVQPVCVHTPDVERYFKSTAGVRRFIDKFLSTYKPVDNGIPF
jgi:hypothetical protein